MKKFLLTSFVILSFIAYSLHQRGDRPSTAVKAPLLANTPTAQTTQPAITNSPAPAASTAYKDGQYTGSTEDAFYGFVQVLAVISNGKLTEVRFLQYPNDRSTSVEINSQAMPYLQKEAIQAQSAHVNIVSGASDTSQAFIQSLTNALDKAKS